MRLHGSVRGSATWRVRIALALKNLRVEHALLPIAADSPRPAGGAWPAMLPGFSPTMTTEDGQVLSQSMAILEWLEERWPTPPLLPAELVLRARVRGFALTVACDVQPMLSGRVLRRLGHLGMTEVQIRTWLRQSLDEGLSACEVLLSAAEGPFCFGSTPTLADICLVPQLALARELNCDTTFPRLLAAEAACLTLPAFHLTRPPPDDAAQEPPPDAH